MVLNVHFQVPALKYTHCIWCHLRWRWHCTHKLSEKQSTGEIEEENQGWPSEVTTVLIMPGGDVWITRTTCSERVNCCGQSLRSVTWQEINTNSSKSVFENVKLKHNSTPKWYDMIVIWEEKPGLKICVLGKKTCFLGLICLGGEGEKDERGEEGN